MAIFINGKLVKEKWFVSNECYINLDHDLTAQSVTIEAIITNSNDIIALLLSVNAIRSITKARIHLHLPYLPYARQDKIQDINEAFGLVMIAKVINSLKCDSITLVAPHSKLSKKLIKNATVIDMSALFLANESLVQSVIKKNMVLVTPDKGGYAQIKKIQKALFNRSQIKLDILQMHKSRANGEVKVSIPASNIIRANNFIIIDDICETGETIIQAKNQILKSFSGDISIQIYIAHMFQYGLNRIGKHFSSIQYYHLQPFIGNYSMY